MSDDRLVRRAHLHYSALIGEWVLWIPAASAGNPEVIWKREDMPTLAERDAALASLGFEYAKGPESAWEYMELQRRDEPVRLVTLVEVVEIRERTEA